MSFSDWDFFTRVTEQTIPSNIQILSETGSPLVDSASLNIMDSGSPAVATVTIALKNSLFPNILESGRIRTVFERKTGSGFRDQGVYFLSSGRNSTLDGVQGYSAHITDGSGNFRISKFTDGLHNLSGFTTLQTFNTTFSGSTESVVMEIEWFGGVIADFLEFTSIEVKFGENTTDFSDLISLGTVSDTSFTTGNAGIWVRSRNSSESLDAIIDNTYVYSREFI